MSLSRTQHYISLFYSSSWDLNVLDMVQTSLCSIESFFEGATKDM